MELFKISNQTGRWKLHNIASILQVGWFSFETEFAFSAVFKKYFFFSFRENGYTTLSSGKNKFDILRWFRTTKLTFLPPGKIFHGYHNNSKNNDFPWSWDEKPFQVKPPLLRSLITVNFPKAADIDLHNMSYHLWPEVLRPLSQVKRPPCPIVDHKKDE